MPIVASCLPRAILRPTAPPPLPLAIIARHRPFLSPLRFETTVRPGFLVAASAASFDELNAKGWSKPRTSKKTLISDLIQEIEPLDLNLIQKDVPAVTVDAMKRTISGMLGILPSDKFNVVVEALWKRLFKLLVSSMMTGYTLRNAEYRLSLERNLEIFADHQDKEGHLKKVELENVTGNEQVQLLNKTSTIVELPERREEVQLCEDMDFEGLGEMTSEAKEYIHNLKCRLSSMEKDLHEVNRKNSALQMQQFVGEEKNDLLDYLRSLQPEKDKIHSDEYILSIAGFKLKETSRLGPRQEKPIEIYEFESCPFCRKVREIISILDLDALLYPCPKNGPNFRPKVLQMGGKQQFPYMVDPNTGVSMYESDAIIKYLVNKYGDGTVPLMLSLGLLTTLTEGFAMIGRKGKGSSYKPSRLPPMPLELWSYEPSPFCKIVREELVELELPHLLHSTARGSPKRQQLLDKTGHFQVPYLEDPNTGVKMFESAYIIEYLRATYALDI